MREQATIEVNRLWEALRAVKDPEFPVSVVDLGLIYALRVEGEGRVVVDMTYTSTACGCMEWIEEDIRRCLLQEPGVEEVIINVVWDPPWTKERMNEAARQRFREWGISL
ncbi:MAG TPA: metal-sulfur cluster assembly factor [Calditerricola sp.]|uniref:MIP18 family-like domain-containing protein n=1 Tax=Calditerricola satsumensis TaxID=373054 RepID=A0A8J3FDA8_9BACI|nr:metal-sulfur cluster assembly factor [Calditerricola satsumensis]GGK03582.1 hypothetical protein GCM10007043_17160 [Calditerricola satsumensis]